MYTIENRYIPGNIETDEKNNKQVNYRREIKRTDEKRKGTHKITPTVLFVWYCRCRQGCADLTHEVHEYRQITC